MPGLPGRRLTWLWKKATDLSNDLVPDSELLRRFAESRDAAAFELLVWRHGAMVLGVCRRAMHDTHLAEDAFQATFFVLAQKAGSLHGRNLSGWLYRVARRTATKAIKGKREHPLVEDQPASVVTDPAERDELHRVLDEEIARLPERIRLPVLLCYLGGKSTEDAALALDCPRGTILSRLATARKRLAARLTRRGITLPAIGIGVNLLVPGTAATAARLTPDVVRLALLFTAGRTAEAGSAAVASTLLAQQVVRAMTTAKIFAISGVVFMLAGFGTGTGVWLGGGQQGPMAGQIVAAEQPAKKPPVNPQKTMEGARVNSNTETPEIARLRKLQGAADKAEVEVWNLEVAVEKLQQANFGKVDIRALENLLAKMDDGILATEQEWTHVDEAGLEKLKRDLPHNLQRKLTQEEFEEASKNTRVVGALWMRYLDVQKAVSEIEKKVEKAAADTYRAQMAEALTHFERARDKNKEEIIKEWRVWEKERLESEIKDYADALERRSQAINPLIRERQKIAARIAATRRAQIEIRAIEDQIEIARDVYRTIRRQQLFSAAGLESIPQTTAPSKPEPDPRLDVVLRELAEMRKEIGELKKK